MIAGSLQIKNGYFYIVLNFKSDDGKRKQKWISTGLPVKGNKKQAEQMLLEARMDYTKTQNLNDKSKGVYFEAVMLRWLKGRKFNVSKTTYDGYMYNVNNGILPYFRQYDPLISELKPSHLEAYYNAMLERGLSPNTVWRHHANIRMALDEAVYNELIASNPAERARVPKKETFMVSPYSQEECRDLLKVIKGSEIELIVMIALSYGLRRSEILGLRWKSVNFAEDTILINHSIVNVLDSGNLIREGRDMLKKKSSFRTLPLLDLIKAYLMQERFRQYKGESPNPEAYIFINKKGVVMNPAYVSKEFKRILKEHKLREIRFHDLRHSCANLLITSRTPLIEVQQWLGHSSIMTTADIYSHLAYETKLQSAETIKKI